jgi:hypothetical protein
MMNARTLLLKYLGEGKRKKLWFRPEYEDVPFPADGYDWDYEEIDSQQELIPYQHEIDPDYFNIEPETDIEGLGGHELYGHTSVKPSHPFAGRPGIDFDKKLLDDAEELHRHNQQHRYNQQPTKPPSDPPSDPPKLTPPQGDARDALDFLQDWRGETGLDPDPDFGYTIDEPEEVMDDEELELDDEELEDVAPVPVDEEPIEEPIEEPAPRSRYFRTKKGSPPRVTVSHRITPENRDKIKEIGRGSLAQGVDTLLQAYEKGGWRPLTADALHTQFMELETLLNQLPRSSDRTNQLRDQISDLKFRHHDKVAAKIQGLLQDIGGQLESLTAGREASNLLEKFLGR